ncbi:MAG: hypothetical protein WAW31_02235, partial [Smithella sp.]
MQYIVSWIKVSGGGQELCREAPPPASRRPLNCLGTPGMGVNLWGVSPLYVNPVNVKSSWTLTKVLAEGKGEIVRDRPK